MTAEQSFDASEAEDAERTEGRSPQAWHALAVESLLPLLQSSPEGLSEEGAAARLASHGPNELPRPPKRSAVLRFLAQFNNALIFVLLGGATAAALLDHVVDAAVILAVVILNAIIGFIQEGRAEKALESLSDLISPKASVLRGGIRTSIPVAQIVPGDIVLIEAGDRVPADLRLLSARRLLIDESLLTGESVAAEKLEGTLPEATLLADRSNMAFSGTFVAAGQGVGLVVETGAHTQIGQISSLLSGVTVTATPLLQQIDRFARRFTWFVLLGGALLFAFAVLVRGFDWIEALIAVVALAVGIVPEGLPAVITITLAIGVRRMARRNAVIRKLPAVETLGATSVICTDKTGTLTRNEMTARNVVTTRGGWRATGAGYEPAGRIEGEKGTDADAALVARDLLYCGLLCNDSVLTEAAGQWKVQGDPMESALLTLAMKAGLQPDEVRAAWPRRDVLPFDAADRFMATSHSTPDGDLIAFVKGAPETLFRMARPPFDRTPWEAAIADAGREGERVLAFGMKRLGDDESELSLRTVGDGVEFLGLVGFIDPPRPEAADAIEEARSAGIAVKMITGDHAATALAIARQLRLSDDPQAITGAELEAMSEEELQREVERVSVFARTSPQHKLRIVRALQANGLTVAMTGDGVNDAPSLKQADVGIAMGVKGTEASKEAAEMVLLDDDFASIVAAVREGRTVYDNICKVITWEVPTNGGETLAVVLAILLGFALPINATQILWANLVLAVTLGLVLAFEPPEQGVMQRPPRPRDAPLLSPFLLWRTVVVSILLSGAALGIFFHAMDQGRGLEVARTMVVNMFTIGEVFYLFNVRFSHSTSFTWRGALGTPAVILAVGTLAALQALFTFAPFMHVLFDSRPLTLSDVLLIMGVGFLLMVVLELEKIVLRKLGWFEELRN